MTTNKPGIKIYEPSEKGVTAMRKASFRNTGPDRYVRLSDYKALQSECALLREQRSAMAEHKMAAHQLIGIPASVGICEPIEGFAARPQDIMPAVRDMALKIEDLQAECEKLRSIISDLKDWDCDVSGGFLSLPLEIRRRMQVSLAAHRKMGGEP